MPQFIAGLAVGFVIGAYGTHKVLSHALTEAEAKAEAAIQHLKGKPDGPKAQ